MRGLAGIFPTQSRCRPPWCVGIGDNRPRGGEAGKVGISSVRNGQTELFWSHAESELRTEPERVPDVIVPFIRRETIRTVVPLEDAERVHEWAKDVPGYLVLPVADRPLRFSNRDDRAKRERGELIDFG
jgi:hypothetical protein